MDKGYKTVLKQYTQTSFTEKKSEFITYVSRIESEDEAKEFIESIRKKHRDATHNVFAYILKGTEIARCSDDGEPSGTAGAPVLEVIKREGLVGVCVVVTRYFGGILLGAGGLVRAYAKGAKLGIDEAGTAEFVSHVTFSLAVSYGDYEKISKDIPKYFVLCSDTEFCDVVKLSLSCEKDKFDAFSSYIADLSGGKYKIQITGSTFAPKSN